MRRVFLVAGIIIWSTVSQASGVDLACEYLPSTAGKKTKISFSLPEPLRFGQLVQVAIQPDSGSPSNMNTVVLKDHPYLVLADVYRIETNNSRIVLIKISPDKSKLEVAYVSMGDTQGARFYQGTCRQNGVNL